MKWFRKLFSGWWARLVGINFLFMLLSIGSVCVVAQVLSRYDVTQFFKRNMFPVYFALAVISIVIGSVLSAVLGKRLVQPLVDLQAATKEIAQGNFDVEVPDPYKKYNDLTTFISDFNKMANELKGIETLRNDFIDNVSHEMKTPIASIEGYSALLQDANLTPQERREYTDLIMESTKQLSALSTNLLLLSKLENQEIVVKKQWFRLEEQIRQVILFLEPQWRKKRQIILPELSDIKYYGNAELLTLIWQNLLSNAIKYTQDDGTIVVDMILVKCEVQVTISDNGMGMNEETQKRIFEKFYQGDSHRRVEGNGLGLALVKRIVDLCEGRITVQSRPGAGSSFRVCLPIASPSADEYKS